MMRKIRILLSLILISVWSNAQEIPSSSDFTENRGQWDSRVLYSGKMSDGGYFLTKTGFTIVKFHADDMHRIENTMHGFKPESNGPIFIPDGSKPILKNPIVDVPIENIDTFKIRTHAIRVSFKNANQNPIIIPEKELGGVSNYFIGNDPSKWGQGAKTFLSVLYKNVYPNVDIRFLSTNKGIKYDIIVHPGGDPKKVIMEYEGADRLQISKNKLYIYTSVGQIVEDIPESFMYDPIKGKESTSAKFELLSPTTVGYKTNSPKANQTLIIDPVLIFSSFTGSTTTQYGYTATPGADGSLFSGGISWSAGFPTSVGAYQSNFSGVIDISIFRFNRTGSQRMYATYIGGNDRDYPHSLIADNEGNLVILGRTRSSDYPGDRIGPGGGFDIVATKLNPTGTSLIGSLLIGGTNNDGVNIQDKFESSAGIYQTTYRFYGDDSRSEVIFKDNGNILFVSQTQSSNFPMRGNGFLQSHQGKQDGVIVELNADCTNMIWSSFIGGSENDAAFVLTQSPTTGQIYVAGTTASSNFTGGNPSDFVGTPADGFVSRISSDGSQIFNSIFVSTNRFDGIYGIQTDRVGDIYVMGVAEGGLSTINVNYSNPGGKQFIGKFNPNLNNWIYRTVFGQGKANADISPVAFMVDRCQNLYVGGWGSSMITTTPPMEGTLGLVWSSDAIKSQTDNNDLYFLVLARNSDTLLYASFYGQNNGYPEHVDGGTSRYDQQGVIYMAVCANCNRADYPTIRFPTTPDAWSTQNGSDGCNLAAIKIAFDFTGVSSGVSSYNRETNRFDTIGCVPFNVTLKDTMLNAKSYKWNFYFNGNLYNTLETDNYSIDETFSQVGTYTVELIAIDSSTCNISDTSYINVHVSDNNANLAMDYIRGNDCTKFEYQFNNLSSPPPGFTFLPNTFIWDFGDGTRKTASAGETVSHTYAREGNYKVTLTLRDDRFCNSEEPEELNLRVTENVVAQIAAPTGGCYPYTAKFDNISIGGVSFRWDFGDIHNPGNNTSTDVNPTHLYNQPGQYTVRLIAEDPYTCNKVDTTYFTLTVSEPPVSSFTYSPTVVSPNTPYTFVNNSINATQFKWDFGDNNSRVINSMTDVLHEYMLSGTYTVQLIALNDVGCKDTSTQTLTAVVHPAFDVPNAFTPGRGGENSVIKVRGFGIMSMRWVIYNRWGQKVFESTDKDRGWDGTFNGKLQPMDVYTYTLDLTLTTGENFKKTGDITLIR